MILPAIFNHLWQSTLFAAMVGLLTLALRKNRARVRHGVWLAASIKFLIPISLLISLGGTIPWRPAPQIVATSTNAVVVMDAVSQCSWAFAAAGREDLFGLPTPPPENLAVRMHRNRRVVVRPMATD